MPGPLPTRRRRVLATLLGVLLLLTAGAASGQVPGLSRSIGEVTDLVDRSLHREAVEPGDLVPTEGSSATAAPPPSALAFSEPAAPQTPAPSAPATTGVDAAATAPQAAVAAAAVPNERAGPTTTTTAPPRPPAASAPAAGELPQSSSPATTPTTTTPPAAAPISSVEGSVVATNGSIRSGPHAGLQVFDALLRARPGDRFLFEPGTHQPLRVENINGTSGAPITLAAVDPDNPPIFSADSYTTRAGLHVLRSTHVSLENLRVRRSLWGARIEASEHITLTSLDVRDIGQEGIRVVERSRHVSIRNSTIADTGQRQGIAPDGQPFALFGEGIYLGTGSTEADPVSNVTITGNDIYNTGTEAIDVKAPVSNVTIRNNRIHDIRTGTSGAIVVHLAAGYSAIDPNIVIEQNTVSNITTGTQWRDGVGIVVGSSVDIIGNTFSGIQHYGVRIEDGGPQGSNITARIEGNTFGQIGLDAIWAVGGASTIDQSGNTGL